ncbi:MAG: DUF308 domain-containing protein [Prevotellaceae bacterium]|nr:DUF308 domain-containing protein [Prevotellaceae bacterium]
MKVIQSHIFRALVAIIAGVLLIEYKESMVTWITMAIGILFFVSGVISLITYYVNKNRAEKTDAIVYDANGRQLTGMKPTFPVVGLGSAILGGLLALMPTTFINGLVYILAAILILGAVNQLANLVAARNYAKIGVFYWIMPVLILLVGIIALIRPGAVASAPLLIIGWCMLLYGIVECVNSIKMRRTKQMFEKEQKEDGHEC